MNNIDITYCTGLVEAQIAKSLRYDAAYEQGYRDASQGKQSKKPFGDIARAGYSDGYSAGLVKFFTT